MYIHFCYNLHVLDFVLEGHLLHRCNCVWWGSSNRGVLTYVLLTVASVSIIKHVAHGMFF